MLTPTQHYSKLRGQNLFIDSLFDESQDNEKSITEKAMALNFRFIAKFYNCDVGKIKKLWTEGTSDRMILGMVYIASNIETLDKNLIEYYEKYDSFEQTLENTIKQRKTINLNKFKKNILTQVHATKRSINAKFKNQEELIPIIIYITEFFSLDKDEENYGEEINNLALNYTEYLQEIKDFLKNKSLFDYVMSIPNAKVKAFLIRKIVEIYEYFRKDGVKLAKFFGEKFLILDDLMHNSKIITYENGELKTDNTKFSEIINYLEKIIELLKDNKLLAFAENKDKLIEILEEYADLDVETIGLVFKVKQIVGIEKINSNSVAENKEKLEQILEDYEEKIRIPQRNVKELVSVLLTEGEERCEICQDYINLQEDLRKDFEFLQESYEYYEELTSFLEKTFSENFGGKSEEEILEFLSFIGTKICDTEEFIEFNKSLTKGKITNIGLLNNIYEITENKGEIELLFNLLVGQGEILSLYSPEEIKKYLPILIAEDGKILKYLLKNKEFCSGDLLDEAVELMEIKIEEEDDMMEKLKEDIRALPEFFPDIAPKVSGFGELQNFLGKSEFDENYFKMIKVCGDVWERCQEVESKRSVKAETPPCPSDFPPHGEGSENGDFQEEPKMEILPLTEENILKRVEEIRNIKLNKKLTIKFLLNPQMEVDEKDMETIFTSLGCKIEKTGKGNGKGSHSKIVDPLGQFETNGYSKNIENTYVPQLFRKNILEILGIEI